MRNLIVSFIAVPASVIALHAQAPGYTRDPADTLRYRELSRGQIDVTAPNGAVRMRTNHDATIALTFGRADTAWAWYEALSIGVRSPQGSRTPETASALGQPFLLRLDARGRTETLRTPVFPASFEGVSDLRHQFEDVFLPLPEGGIGLNSVWSDSVTRETSGPRGRITVSQRAGQYHVRGDSMIGGVRVLLVEAQVRSRMDSSGEGPSGTRMRSTLEGKEEGVFYFAPSTGILVGRRRTGELNGAMEITGGPEPVRMPQRLRYENSLELVR